MIVCPNCTHQNPDGALQCEACYTPLPTMTKCPTCGASVQADASFCGQCGTGLQEPSETDPSETAKTEAFVANPPAESGSNINIPDLPAIEPLVIPDPIPLSAENSPENLPTPLSIPDLISTADPTAPDLNAPVGNAPDGSAIAPPVPTPIAPAASPNRTQLQTQSARLLHLQTNMTLEISSTLSVVHIGKPNERVPPDIDVAGFANSEIVSRIHADIRIEGDIYYLEDMGSANGTYVNNTPLLPGNRHRLRAGDRISLGKGDKVSFLFQLS